MKNENKTKHLHTIFFVTSDSMIQSKYIAETTIWNFAWVT